MGSPESEKPASKSPPVQDSPIFGYVSSLSPIKPVNARPIVQVYENIDVPSPQLIFKTPNFCRPRVSSLSERSQHLTSSGTEGFSPGYVNNTREFPGNMDITRASSSMPTAQFSSCSDKECTGGDPSPNQSCTSPSNCVDVFLADPSENGDSSSSSPEFCVNRYTIEREGINASSCKNQMETLKEDFLGVHLNTSAVSVDEKRVESLISRQDANAHHPSQNTVSAKESTADIHAANTKKHTSRMSVMCLRSFRARDQTEEGSGSISLDATMEINKGPTTEQLFQQVSKNVSIHTDAHITLDSITQHNNESANQQVMDPHVSRATFCDPAQNGKENCTTSIFLCHNEEDPNLQTAKSGISDESSGMLQSNPGPPQNIHTGNNHMDNSGQMSFASASNRISYDLEDCAQQQRGKRKRLQFEAADNLRINERDSFNHSTEASNVDMSTASLEAGTLKASHSESMTMSSQSQLLRSNTLSRFLVKVDRSGGSKETSLAAPRPPGLLHLNSIGSAAPTSCNSNMQRAEMNSSIQDEKTVSEDIDEMPEMSKNCPSSVIVIDPENLTSSSEEPLLYAGIKENEENKDGNRPFQKQHSSVSYWSPLNVKPLNTTVPLKHIDRCITPCIMKSLPSVEANKTEEFTQTSPRKKRKKAPDNDGQKRCNCKRSKCLKLYCDCFAAGSYCSEACACYECSNRLEHEETVRETRQQIESRNPLAFAPKVILRVSDPPKPSGDNKEITPTSARHKRGCNCKKSRCLKKYCECFQAGVGCSLGCRCEGCKNTFGTKEGCEISEMVVEHKRPGEGSWERDLSTELEAIEVKRHIANPRRCHPRLSPVTPLLQSSVGDGVTKPQFPSSYFPSPDSVASAVRSHEPSGADMVSMDDGGLAEDGPGASSFTPCDPENEYHIARKVDTFSPGWEGFPDICNLSPLLKTSPSAGGSSSVLKTREHRILQMKLFRGGSRISLGAFCLGSSPVTPMPHFDESKFPREPDSNSGLHCDTEDDTPEILKETCSPVKSVKATSPNQKRVSPPHHVMCGTSTSSPSGLKSGRKYVLQSVPAFPSLTPYSKSNREDGT